MNEPVAIIGIGCRFPGGVHSPETLWQLLVNGENAVGEIPRDRFDVDAFFDEQPATPGKIMSRWGGYLDQVDQFDAAFFGIAPREAERLDPQQRLLLEVAWEALQDAGQNPNTPEVRQTGVFVGLWLSDFEARLFRNPARTDFYMTTGSGRYSASGRLSYVLGLQGPSITLDTACSSSLVAVHLACQSLRNGECDLALAGGANVILQPHITIAYSQSKMMAPDGRCKFGDASANGYVRSEGAGLVVLKRLSQALIDGDPIYAVIRGSAVNNDGQTSGYLATPGSGGQEEMLRKAYANADVSPAAVQYIEAHGTGTNAGDPVEVGALGTVLREGRPAGQVCELGSIKTNLGHTEGAAGVAGLIKVALSLRHQMLPASLHCQQPNPNIPWDDLQVRVHTALTPWPGHTGPATAGVSAFGIAGTNAHVVLQEAPADANSGGQSDDALHAHPVVIPFSAQTPEALLDVVRQYQIVAPPVNLRDLAYTLGNHRVHHGQRLAVVAQTPDELADQLDAFLNQEGRRGLAVTGERVSTEQRVVFLFPGQGGQWVGMGRRLLDTEPVFADMMERCQAALSLFVDWQLIDEIRSGSRFEEIDVIQPALFAVEVSLAALWRSWGVAPDAIIGHSMGEVAGAYVAGILTLEDAAHVICRRSQLMKQVSGQGAMAVVELTFEEAAAAIRGYEDQLGIAVSNGPRSTVLSGDPAALETVLEGLRAQEIFCRPVKVDVAAHSPHMDALRPDLVSDLPGLQAQSSTVPVYSTVTGTLREGETFNADYWGDNLRQPVRFAAAVRDALDDGYTTFIEMSPHPVLLAAVEQGIQAAGVETGLTLLSTRRDEDESAVMRESLGALYAAGYPVNWQLVYLDGQTLRLPTYPWQRERFWAAEAELGAVSPHREGTADHPLLGQYFQSHTGAHFWETDLDLAALPYLADHRVQGQILLPAAAYAEMFLEAAVTAFGAGLHQLEAVNFLEAMFLSEEAPRTVQVVLMPEGGGRFTAQCFSSPAGDEPVWTLHASGLFRAGVDETVPVFQEPAAIQQRLPEAMSGSAHYATMNRRRLGYGPAFQGIAQSWRSEAEALAELRVVDGLHTGGYQIHPALLDACFQALLDTLPDDPPDTYVPVSLRQLTLVQPPGSETGLWAYTQRTESADDLAGDVLLLDVDGQVILQAEGLKMQRLERGDEALHDLLYEVVWQAVDVPITPTRPSTSGNWLILSDQGGVGAALAAQLVSLGETVVSVEAGAEYAVADDSHYQINPGEPENFVRVLREIDLPWRGIVHLWSLDAAACDFSLDGLHTAEMLNAASALYLTQAVAAAGARPNLWFVTRGAQAVLPTDNPDVRQSPLWGLAAVIANEHPELYPALVDLGATQGVEALTGIFFSGQMLDAVALRDEQSTYQRRLRHATLDDEPRYEVRQTNADEQPFTAVTTMPGVLEGLRLRELARHEPGAGQVEIEVQATGLNFMNVLSALGAYPGYPQGVGPLGIECAGRIIRIGPGVTGWQVGDPVVAFAFNSLGSHALADARLVAAKPDHLTFAEAATIPIVFLTAYYALYRLGRLEAGERVLIHSAAGGVGLAAIQLARLAGAEVFATAGTPEKRAYLHDLGVETVLDSRTLAFADDLLDITGDGVDVVLNSLAGEAITRGLAVLRPYGRFLELGKRDVYQNRQIGLLPFQNNLSYFMIDLDRMTRERPAQVGAMLQEIMALVADGSLQPLPLTVFPVSQVVDAFRHMAQAKHIGKVVIAMTEADVPVEVSPAPLVRRDGTYLISGGAGGLGLAVARWLAEQGAGQLILTGRSAPSLAAQAAIQAIEAAGTPVWFAQGDVAHAETVRELIEQVGAGDMPLRGVVHAAGILDDSMLMQMQPEQFRRAIRPKLDGAWNLHEFTGDCPLDFFVTFSSVTALLGTPGQGNYAAGNAFLDALMQHRHANGQPALSINWGPWSEVGLAAAQLNRGERLASRGLGSITPQQGIALLVQLLRQPTAQMAVMAFDAAQWSQTYPPAAASSLLADLLQAESAATPAEESTQVDDVRARLLAIEPGPPRRKLLEDHLREQVARVLGLSPSRIDIHKPLRNLGIDSLMTLELRSRLESTLKIPLSATLIFNFPTVSVMTDHLAEKLNIPLTAAQAVEPTAAPAADKSLEGLSQDELESLLADELDSLDDLLKGTY
ncbi:MAG: type I polyketide synthase [Anaerolineaceae bacterium]|nr:type I polyketide synthase [Anaerolineaceae bacterium]